MKNSVSTYKIRINQAIDMRRNEEATPFGLFLFLQVKRATKAPGSKILARARAVSFDRGGSKRTFAMLMVSAGKLAFKAKKKAKEAPKRAKNESQDP